MKDKDNIRELFSEKLGSFEAPVSPDVWSKVASQLGSTGAAAVGGVSVLAKVIIGAAAVVTITAASIFVFYSPNDSEEKPVTTREKHTSLDSEKTHVEQFESVDSVDNLKSIKNQATAESNKPENAPEGSNQVALQEISQEQNFRKEAPIIKLPTPIETTISPSSEDKSPNQQIQEKVENKATQDIETSFPEDIVSESKGYTLGKLPNIFTPNNDGSNDFFLIESSGLEDFTLVVLNDKQQVVFETSDVNFKWDGTTRNGTPIEEGTYSYYLIAKDRLGNAVKKFMKLSVYR